MKLKSGNVIESELKLFKQMETDTDVEFSQVEPKQIFSLRGLVIDKEGHVVGANLTDIRLPSLPSDLLSLEHLTTLYLRNCKVIDLSNLSRLSNLKTFSMMNNRKTDLSFLSKLTNLETLRLVNIELSDISFLSKLTNLRWLNVSSNPIDNLSDLKNLTRLTNLHMGSCKLEKISALSAIKKLKTLELNFNNIVDVSPLSALSELEILDLWKNKISDISPLSNLKKLHHLELKDNDIKEIPQAIFDLNMDMYIEKPPGKNGMIFSGNPLESPPPEIIRQGKDACRAYFKSIKPGEKRPLNEVKLLLVGDGEAGKTSLANKLTGKQFNKNESKTDGINIEKWRVVRANNTITTRIWDFGGQEIMHDTHQFFLSKRSLYILVLDGRKDDKTEYWLRHIQSFGGDSPVLIVLNKIDKNPSFEVNRKFLLEKYPNIKGFYPLSCATGKGVEDFKKALQLALDSVEIKATIWGKEWFKVKERLETMTEHFIDYDRYRKICKEAGLTDPDAIKALVDFLNDLGVVVHFNDFHLQDIHVLEPRWVTEAVYTIINSDILANAEGILHLSKLHDILKHKNNDGFTYLPETYPYIIRLMEKFELCYKMDEERYLAPRLLKTIEPIFDFSYKKAIHLIFEYEFLPFSVMPRLIVRLHKDIKECCQWRTGVLLHDEDLKATALIRADETDRKLDLYVTGAQKRSYFSHIRKTIRSINADFKKLEVKELVPLPSHPDITVEYDELIGHEIMGRESITIGKLRTEVPLPQLLEPISTIDEREEDRHRIQRKDHKSGDIIVQPIVTLQHQNIQNQQTNMDVNINIDIKVELPAFEESFHQLKQALLRSPNLDELTLKELEKIEDGLDNVSANSGKEKLLNPFKKVQRFLEGLGDETSPSGKFLKGSQKALELAKNAAKTYNKIAPWLGLPTVPPPLLE